VRTGNINSKNSYNLLEFILTMIALVWASGTLSAIGFVGLLAGAMSSHRTQLTWDLILSGISFALFTIFSILHGPKTHLKWATILFSFECFFGATALNIQDAKVRELWILLAVTIWFVSIVSIFGILYWKKIRSQTL
jgi:hypothetical protein